MRKRGSYRVCPRYLHHSSGRFRFLLTLVLIGPSNFFQSFISARKCMLPDLYEVLDTQISHIGAVQWPSCFSNLKTGYYKSTCFRAAQSPLAVSQTTSFASTILPFRDITPR